MRWEGKRRRGSKCIHDMATTLRDAGVLTGLGHHGHLPERDLIVLDSDDVMNDERWQYLKETSDRGNMTGPDPRRRTVVFSSITLLGNAVWCDDMLQTYCAWSYGFSQSRGSQTFHPLLLVRSIYLGEGEREIVVRRTPWFSDQSGVASFVGIQKVVFTV
jgi:hypothetical protein